MFGLWNTEVLWEVRAWNGNSGGQPLALVLEDAASRAALIAADMDSVHPLHSTAAQVWTRVADVRAAEFAAFVTALRTPGATGGIPSASGSYEPADFFKTTPYHASIQRVAAQPGAPPSGTPNFESGDSGDQNTKWVPLLTGRVLDPGTWMALAEDANGHFVAAAACAVEAPDGRRPVGPPLTKTNLITASARFVEHHYLCNDANGTPILAGKDRFLMYPLSLVADEPIKYLGFVDALDAHNLGRVGAGSPPPHTPVLRNARTVRYEVYAQEAQVSI